MRYFIFLSTFFLGSCATNAGTGVIAGTVLGAGFGAAGGGTKGALIGTATGAAIGTIIGAVLDVQDRKVMEKNSPRTVDRMDRNEPLTINDVIKLSQSGVSDDTILNYMSETSSYYHLSQTQVRRLQDAGVSQRIINTMLVSGQ